MLLKGFYTPVDRPSWAPSKYDECVVPYLLSKIKSKVIFLLWNDQETAWDHLFEHGQLAMVKSKPAAVPTCAGAVVALPAAYMVFPYAEHLKMSSVSCLWDHTRAHTEMSNSARVAKLPAHHRGTYTSICLRWKQK